MVLGVSVIQRTIYVTGSGSADKTIWLKIHKDGLMLWTNL